MNKAWILPFLLASCAPVKMVSVHGNSQSMYAPTNETKGGVISFPEGSEKKRDEAYQQMYEYCGGNYKITKEEVHVDVVRSNTAGPVIPMGGGIFLNTANTRSQETRSIYASFECVNQGGSLWK